MVFAHQRDDANEDAAQWLVMEAFGEQLLAVRVYMGDDEPLPESVVVFEVEVEG